MYPSVSFAIQKNESSVAESAAMGNLPGSGTSMPLSHAIPRGPIIVLKYLTSPAPAARHTNRTPSSRRCCRHKTTRSARHPHAAYQHLIPLTHGVITAGIARARRDSPGVALGPVSGLRARARLSQSVFYYSTITRREPRFVWRPAAKHISHLARSGRACNPALVQWRGFTTRG